MPSRLALATVLSLCACPSGSDPAAPPPAEERVVRTSSAILRWMTASIAADVVPVEYGLPADADPGHWTAQRDVVRRFQAAALLVFNGAGYESWARQATLPGSRVVQTAAGFEDRWIRREEKTHSHGSGPAHTHATVDPAVWLDPTLAALQARAIHAALDRRFPGNTARFDQGLAAVLAALQEMDQRLEELSAVIGDRPVVAAHPSFAYAARRYGWKLRDLDLPAEDADALGPEVHVALDEARGSADFGLLLFDRPVSEAVRARCAEWSWRAVEFDTLERPRDGEDPPARMAGNCARITGALE